MCNIHNNTIARISKRRYVVLEKYVLTRSCSPSIVLAFEISFFRQTTARVVS